MTDPYERDFYAWTQEQAGHLRAGRLDSLDLDHLVEEIESKGIGERREIRNRLRILLLHLLKWEHQPDRRSSSWSATITEQRAGIDSVLADSPSLSGFPQTILDDCYHWAVRQAAVETGLPEEPFPPSCPYPLKDILDPRFWAGRS